MQAGQGREAAAASSAAIKPCAQAKHWRQRLLAAAVSSTTKSEKTASYYEANKTYILCRDYIQYSYIILCRDA